MIQDNFILLLCLTFLVLAFIIYQYNEINKTQKTSLIELELIRDQIDNEKKFLEQSNKEVVKLEDIEECTNKKLKIIKTKIVTLDFSCKELIECIARS